MTPIERITQGLCPIPEHGPLLDPADSRRGSWCIACQRGYRIDPAEGSVVLDHPSHDSELTIEWEPRDADAQGFESLLRHVIEASGWRPDATDLGPWGAFR